MSDPRQSVRPGQRLEIAASQINFLNQLMASNVTPVSGPLAGWNFTGNTVLVKNTTASTVARWGVLKIDGILIDPNDGDTQRREFESMPCVNGVEAAAGEEHSVVVLEPIAPGKIGRCAVAGVVQIASSDVAKVGGSLVLWQDADWALIRFGGGERLRFGRITSSWAKGTVATVNQLKGDGSLMTGDPTFQAKNHFTDLFVDCGERKVACGLVDSTWILLAADCGTSAGS